MEFSTDTARFGAFSPCPLKPALNSFVFHELVWGKKREHKGANIFYCQVMLLKKKKKQLTLKSDIISLKKERVNISGGWEEGGKP